MAYRKVGSKVVATVNIRPGIVKGDKGEVVQHDKDDTELLYQIKFKNYGHWWVTSKQIRTDK